MKSICERQQGTLEEWEDLAEFLFQVQEQHVNGHDLRLLEATACADVEALGRLARDDSWPARAQAARSLGATGYARVIVPLFHCLEDANEEVRIEASRSLKMIADRLQHATLSADLPDLPADDWNWI